MNKKKVSEMVGNPGVDGHYDTEGVVCIKGDAFSVSGQKRTESASGRKGRGTEGGRQPGKG